MTRSWHVRLAALLGFVLLCLPSLALAQPLVRKEVSDLTPAEVASLRRGVQVMMDRNAAPRDSADFRRSWLYWANAHAYYGDDCRGPLPTGGQGYADVRTHQASTPAEHSTWCKCKHGTPDFLTWHRMYLFYFESVLREASGNPTVTLPYWNYQRNRQLPQIFRDRTYVDSSGAVRRNPLFVAARQSDIARGQPLDPAFVAVDTAFRQRRYTGALSTPRVLGFNEALERTPHGAVHCAIGVNSCPSGLMGDVPTAGLDPIFYLHHANLDRLYECWLGPVPGNRLPSQPQIVNQSYSFVDGTGRVQTKRASDMLRLSQLGFTYGRPETCPPPPPGGGTTFLSAEQPQSFSLGGPGALRRDVTRVPLEIAPETRNAINTSRFLAATVEQRLLVIHNVRFDRPPGTQFRVYLTTPGNQRAYAGIISFFGATASGGAGHDGHDESARDAMLDVTTSLASISPTGNLPEGLALEFVPATGVAGSSTAAAAANIPADANVRYDSVELIVVPQ